MVWFFFFTPQSRDTTLLGWKLFLFHEFVVLRRWKGMK